VPNAPCSAPNWRGRWINALGLAAALALFATGAVAQDALFSFAISAQPLAAALEQYSAVTGRDVLYNSNLAIGRQSNGAHGRQSADTALGALLEGTGLSAQRIAQESFVLAPISSAMDSSTPVAVSDYYGRIQISLRTALCGDSLARPGSYRIAMRFRITDDGSVMHYEQFGSGGSADIDEAIRRTVSHLRIGAQPPASLGQPVVIVILPQAPGLTGCNGTAPSARAQ
jgi:Secretin and TonB N terminus short domain